MRLLLLTLLMLSITLSTAGQDMPKFPPSQDFYVEALVDNIAPYAGQQMVYTFRLYSATTPETEFDPPDFEGFWRGDQFTTQTAELVGGRQYVVTSTAIILYPTRTGVLMINPSQLIIPETVFSNRPRLDLTTDPVLVNVLPLPDDAPAGFDGAVGQMETRIEIDKQNLQLGEPLNLRYTVSGIGNVELLPTPELPLPDGWRAYPNPSIVTTENRGALRVAEKVFEWRLIPDKAGSHEFPPVIFTYFDPQEAAYKSVASSPFQVVVLPAENGLLRLPEITNLAANSATMPLKTVPISSENPEANLGVLWVLPPLLVFGVWGVLRYQEYREKQRILSRRNKAVYAARRKLEKALKLNGEKAFAMIESAIIGYFSDKLNRDVQRHELDELAGQVEVGEVLFCLRQAEEGRYAPNGTIDANELITRTAESLTALEQVYPPPYTGEGNQAATLLKVIPLFLILLVISTVNADPRETAQQAVDAYNAGDFASAITLYETLVTEGVVNAAVFYNLGSAYFESDDLGRALLNFRRALLYDPRDFDINRGVALVRALRVDVMGDETALIDNVAAVTGGLLTTAELTVFVFLLWTAWFGLLLLWVLRGDRFRLAVYACGIVLVIMLTLLLGRYYVEQNRPMAVVTGFTAQAMSGPGEDYVPLYLLYSGAEMRLLETRDGWVRFALPDGRQGWMSLESVEKV